MYVYEFKTSSKQDKTSRNLSKLVRIMNNKDPIYDTYQENCKQIKENIIQSITEGTKEGIKEGVKNGFLDGIKQCTDMGFLDLMNTASKDIEEILNTVTTEAIEQEVENSVKQEYVLY